jgi:hypothetical protein
VYILTCCKIKYFCSFSYHYVFIVRFVGLNYKQGSKGLEGSREELPNSSWESSLRSYHTKERRSRKDKILLSLVDRLKPNEAKLAAQAETHEAEVEELKRKVAEATKKIEVEAVKHEICEIERSRAQKNPDELRASKEKCYEISLKCTMKLKDNFARVGPYSSKQKFIRGGLDGVVQWISGEVEAFDEILSDRGDFCAFAGARGPHRS